MDEHDTRSDPGGRIDQHDARPPPRESRDDRPASIAETPSTENPFEAEHEPTDGPHRDESDFVFPLDDGGSASRTSASRDALNGLPGDARNVLVEEPSSAPDGRDFCTSLLTEHDAPPNNLLLVTIARSVDERFDDLSGHLDREPDRLAVIGLGDVSRSTAAGQTVTDDGGAVTVETISDARDVQRLGMAISRYLTEWQGGGDTAICVHSVSDLLSFIEDHHLVFKFLHILAGRVRAADATAHYHVDPNAHEAETVSTFHPIFDAILTADGVDVPGQDRERASE